VKYYSPWKRGYVPPKVTPEPPQKAPREATVQFPGRTLPTVAIGFKGPAWSATDRVVVAAGVLGPIAFGENSEIYRRLVLEQQKVQSLGPSFDVGRDPDLLTVLAMVKESADVEMVKAEIARTVASFRSETCDPKVLADTKSAMKYGFLMRLETPQGINFALRPFVVNTGGAEAVEDYYRTLDAVTPEDVKAAAARYLVDAGRTTVTLVAAGEVKR
jgi:zinc protease